MVTNKEGIRKNIKEKCSMKLRKEMDWKCTLKNMQVLELINEVEGKYYEERPHLVYIV